MRYSNNFVLSAAVLILSPLTTALPIDESPASDGSAFKVTQVLNTAHVPNGARAYAKALSKYGAPVPEHVQAAAASAANATGLTRRQGQQGTVIANTQGAYDTEYLCPVSIGTQGQTVTLDFDTGSADLWVFTPSTAGKGSQALYDPTKSSTSSLQSGYTWQVGYGDGSGASGNVYMDKVAVGAATATSQAVEAATSVSSGFAADTASDGLLGLGFSNINTVKPVQQKTFFFNILSSLAAPVFTSNLKYHAAGNYNFGYIDKSEYSSPSITYTPVDSSSGYWGLTGSGYAVGTGPFNTTNINTVADTGTSLLLLPAEIAAAYYAAVPNSAINTAAGGWTFPCSQTPPDFTFGVGDYRGVVPGKYINYAPISGGNPTCFGGIQSSAGITDSHGKPMSIYGDILLKSQFVVFDGGKTQLGWAQQAGVSG